MKSIFPLAAAIAFALATPSIDAATADAAPALPPKPASAATAARNAAVLQELPFADRVDFEAARRGLVAPSKGRSRTLAARSCGTRTTTTSC